MASGNPSVLTRYGVHASAIMGVFVGGAWLLAWMFGIVPRWSTTGMLSVKTNTALCLFLAGSALMLLFPEKTSSTRRTVGTAAAVLVLLVGSLTLSAELFHHNLEIDRLLSNETSGISPAAKPNRMGLPASSSLTLLALGLIALATRFRRYTPYFGLAVCAIVCVPALSYIYGGATLYNSSLIGIPWPAVVALLSLGVGLILAHQQSGPMLLLLRDDPGGILVRRLLPAAILVPPLFGYLRILAEQFRWFDSMTINTLLVVGRVLILLFLLWQAGSFLSNSAAMQAKVTRALKQSEDQFRLLADSIPQLAWMANGDGSVFWYNRRWFEYTGRTLQQMERLGWRSVLNPEEFPKIMEQWSASIARGEPVDEVFSLRGKDSIFRPFLTRVMPVKDSHGKIIRWFGTSTDISAQKQVEEELRKSKARLDLAMSVLDLGEWELNLKDKTAIRSLRHDQIFGYETLRPDWTHETFVSHVLPQYRDEVNAGLQTSAISGIWDLEVPIRRVDGTVRWIWVRGRSLPEETGQPTRVIGTIMDTTDRKRAEQHVAHLASFPEMSPNAIFETDLEGKLTYINPAARRDLPSLPSSGSSHILLRGWTDTIASLREKGERSIVREIETDGHAFLETIHYSPEIGVVRAYLTDISELREKEERFRSMYKHAAVGIEQVSSDGHTLMVNPALCRMLGYTEAELMSKTFIETTHPEDRAREAEMLKLMFSGESDSYEIEKRYLRNDGSVLWASVTSSLVKTGQLPYRISIIQDITESRRAEEQLKEVQKMEAIGRLAGGVAHDFNTLLSVILGYSELAIRELPEMDPCRTRLEYIEKSARAGAQLTRQLLAFSRNQAIAQQVLDLKEVVAALEPMLRRLLPEDIEILIRSSEETHPVKSDFGQLQQLVLNLAGNAGHAMPRGGRLTIDLQSVLSKDVQQLICLPPGRYEVLTVADTGTGMDAETVAHIFEPFFTTKPIGEGTGLGLATVYGIVKQSGGDISVLSQPGAGSTFRVYLPHSSKTLRQESVPIDNNKQKLSGTETILLVEDSAPLRDLVRELLSRQGYSVIEAADGVEALEISRSHSEVIHLLLTDIVMPRMRGPELAGHILQERSDIAVLFMSGYAADETSLPVQGARIKSLEKPCKSEVLLKTVRQVLDEPQHYILQEASGQ